jgi:hypothetical protein
MGVANTAFMKSNDRIFALFERDLPYEISVDHDKQTVNTLGKITTPSITHFSGHSRFENERIKTMAYNVLEKKVEYREFDDDFILKRSIDFKTTYLPIIHDFITTDSNTVLFTDAPFKITTSFKNPVVFDMNQTTIFHIKKRNILYKIDTNESIYIFHYGPVKETPTTLEFYAAAYENIDFSKIDISGKYRKFNICLRTGKVAIDKNPDLEKYNLDFPVKCDQYTLLRNLDMKNRRINGFLLCDGFSICDSFFFEDRSFCGEPVIIDTISGEKYMAVFAYNQTDNYLVLIRILETGQFDKDFIEIPVHENIGPGFHSAFFSSGGSKFINTSTDSFTF